MAFSGGRGFLRLNSSTFSIPSAQDTAPVKPFFRRFRILVDLEKLVTSYTGALKLKLRVFNFVIIVTFDWVEFSGAYLGPELVAGLSFKFLPVLKISCLGEILAERLWLDFPSKATF